MDEALSLPLAGSSGVYDFLLAPNNFAIIYLVIFGYVISSSQIKHTKPI
jgi:hypothetical protein